MSVEPTVDLTFAKTPQSGPTGDKHFVIFVKSVSCRMKFLVTSETTVKTVLDRIRPTTPGDFLGHKGRILAEDTTLKNISDCPTLLYI